MSLLLAFLKTYWRQVAGALAVLAILWFAWAKIDAYGDRREAAGENRVQAAWDASVVRGERELAAAERRVREQEKTRQSAYDAAAKALTEERDRAIQERDAAVAGLRDGTLRVRDRFRCPGPAATPVVPGLAGTPGGSDAAGGGGLSPADAEFLLRIGAEADDVVRRLTTCQRLLANPEK